MEVPRLPLAIGGADTKRWLENLRDQVLARELPSLPSRDVKHGYKARVDKYLSYWSKAGGRVTLAIRVDAGRPQIFLSEVKARRGKEVETEYDCEHVSEAVGLFLERLREIGQVLSAPPGKSA